MFLQKNLPTNVLVQRNNNHFFDNRIKTIYNITYISCDLLMTAAELKLLTENDHAVFDNRQI